MARMGAGAGERATGRCAGSGSPGVCTPGARALRPPAALAALRAPLAQRPYGPHAPPGGRTHRAPRTGAVRGAR
ncbi:hypothetical protein ABZ128_32250 [Streptomyces sp. NPDC006326]|uniref:hypothetical protein n=1 Tax=Streptomyces sp. NPDC006326 TaxID=3156752 RepID=UPI0033A869D3